MTETETCPHVGQRMPGAQPARNPVPSASRVRNDHVPIWPFSLALIGYIAAVALLARGWLP